MREVFKDHERHEHKLITVRVLVVAGFPVTHPRRQVIVVDDQDVGNTPHPNISGLPLRGLEVNSQRHLVLGQLASRLLDHGVSYIFELGVLRGNFLAIPDIQLQRFMHLIAISCCLCLLKRVVLQDLDLVVPAGAALEVFEGAV